MGFEFVQLIYLKKKEIIITINKIKYHKQYHKVAV